MVKKIDKFEFNKDMDKYVGKVSKSNTRFINLKEFIKKDKKLKTEVDNNNHEHETELIELKERKGIELIWFNFLKIFNSKNDDEIDESKDVTEEISLNEDELIDEEHFEEESVEEELNEEKINKTSFFDRLFCKNNNKNEMILEKKNEELIHDLKCVSVFAKDLLDFIPKDELENLKMDGTLDEFKNILKKNSLLKKKE